MTKPHRNNIPQTQTNSHPTHTDSPPTEVGAGGCLVRLGWMIWGTAALLMTVVFIVKQAGAFSIADAVFWSIVAVCIGLRYVDIRYLNGQTASGEPATFTHWWRYSLLLGAVALALWGVAHVIGYLFG